MARQRFKDSDPVEEILTIALENQGAGTDTALQQRLMASAAELGLSRDAVEEAKQQWLEKRRRKGELEAYRTSVRNELWGHIGVYVVTNAILAMMNMMSSSYPWFIWPLLGWGIGVGCHAVAAIIELRNPTDRDFERWRRKRRRDHEFDEVRQSLEA